MFVSTFSLVQYKSFYLNPISGFPLFEPVENGVDDVARSDLGMFLVHQKLRTKSGLDVKSSVSGHVLTKFDRNSANGCKVTPSTKIKRDV